MEFGICVASRPEDLDYVVEAEALGYTHCWMADSQMIWSDVYALLALAADRTTTMRIGTGVAVAPTRPAPVTAAAIATINQLAPGRTFLGIGTGNTAMRTMGHKPMRVSAFDAYLSNLAPLMRGEETDLAFAGDLAPARHLMTEHRFVAFEPRIPLYISAFGPKSLALAVRHGDGLITSVPPEPDAVRNLRAGLDAIAAELAIPMDRARFPVATLTTMVVLEDGEAVDSARCRDLCGAFAIAAVHYAYEQHLQYGRKPPAHMADFWDDYVALVEQTPLDRRHLRTHLGHNCWVEPDEEQFVTRELIERSCLVGTADQLATRVKALDDAGLDQIVLLPPLATKEDVIRSVASDVFPRLRS